MNTFIHINILVHVHIYAYIHIDRYCTLIYVSSKYTLFPDILVRKYHALPFTQGSVPEINCAKAPGTFSYNGGELGPESGRTENEDNCLLFCIGL